MIFWEQIFEWQDTEQAGQIVETAWTQTDASPVGIGTATRMGSSPFENGGFEDGVSPWVGGAGDPLSVVSEQFGFLPLSGSKMGTLYLKDGQTKTYASMRQQICAYPGEDVNLSLSWRAVTRELGSCTTANPQYLSVRHDTVEERVNMHFLTWADICADLYDDAWRVTDWKRVELSYTIPETAEPGEQFISFGTGGYGTDIWYLLFDDVEFSYESDQAG